MAAFLSDQNFEDDVVLGLMALGHDVATVRSVGLERAPDSIVLAFATNAGRAVLTHDKDFRILHRSGVAHAGIVFASLDSDFAALAMRIDVAVSASPVLAGQLIRVVRPNKTQVH